jgi:hypothetical protein
MLSAEVRSTTCWYDLRGLEGGVGDGIASFEDGDLNDGQIYRARAAGFPAPAGAGGMMAVTPCRFQVAKTTGGITPRYISLELRPSVYSLRLALPRTLVLLWQHASRGPSGKS